MSTTRGAATLTYWHLISCGSFSRGFLTLTIAHRAHRRNASVLAIRIAWLGTFAHHSREARITTTTVEIFHRGTRVASHAFSAVRNRHTTIPEHMPSAHRRHAEWTPACLMQEAKKIGQQRSRSSKRS